MLHIFVGLDTRENVAYHTFCQSVLEKATIPVSFTPLALNTLKDYTETHTDGSKRNESFKARHAKNIAKGKMSAAFWANKVKW